MVWWRERNGRMVINEASLAILLFRRKTPPSSNMMEVKKRK
jgi:hypothetical protein